MKLPFSLFLALRYLKPKRTFLSVVTLFSILGVLLGVMVLVIVISVMSGFDDMWREKILSFNAHITVTGFDAIETPEEVMKTIKGVEGVKAVAPLIEGLGFIQHDGRVYTPIVRGIDPEREARISGISGHMISGDFSVDDEQILIGHDLARRVGADVGDILLIYSPQSFASSVELQLPEECAVSGIYEMGMWDFDIGFAMVSLEVARDLFAIDEGVQSIQVITEDPFKAHVVAHRLRETLGFGFNVQTWMELNRTLFAALRVEKKIMFFLLIFIVIVASFGITNTLITTTYQKTKEIGLLRALGFSSGRIMRVFVWQGLIEGVLGTAAGILSGLVVLRYRNPLLDFLSAQFNIELLPESLYQLSEIPSYTSWVDITSITAMALLICTCAALLPAYRAARLDPMRALRNE